MGTPHNMANMGEIAKTVLLPGDPLRAKVIAETYLENPVQFNSVRNMFGFTGTYKGKEVSVMGTGMGMPSMGIYSHELIHFYGVKNLIRIGSCGSIARNVKIGDIVMAQGACTDSNYAHQYHLPGTFSALASFDLLRRAVKAAEARSYPYVVGNVLSSDIFYNDTPEWKSWARMGCLALEMESYALYCNAAAANSLLEKIATDARAKVDSILESAGVNALAIFTVSDSLLTGEATTAEERQNNFTNMMEVALDVAAEL
ncbi:MAG: purine-nucleoside phosphorylase [Eubacteriales bacterium]|nr:purine-nucleoside phosphorylase [Eubacteriales bacterium]